MFSVVLWLNFALANPVEYVGPPESKTYYLRYYEWKVDRNLDNENEWVEEYHQHVLYVP